MSEESVPSKDCMLANEKKDITHRTQKNHLSPARPNESFEYTEIELCVDTVR
jgi:hypothetical protein